MQPVRQLDQDHADVLRHGEEHLPQILRLQLHLVLGIVQLSQLGYPVHKKGYLGTEFLLHFLIGHPGVLHSVMEKPCNNGLFVKFQIRQDDSDAKGMNDIGFSRFSLLILMRFPGHLIGLLYHGNVCGWMIFSHTGDQFLIQIFRTGEIAHGLHRCVRPLYRFQLFLLLLYGAAFHLYIFPRLFHYLPPA